MFFTEGLNGLLVEAVVFVGSSNWSEVIIKPSVKNGDAFS